MSGKRVNRLSVMCPRCFMPEGILCRDTKGWSLTLGHIERVYAARVRAAEREEKEKSR